MKLMTKNHKTICGDCQEVVIAVITNDTYGLFCPICKAHNYLEEYDYHDFKLAAPVNTRNQIPNLLTNEIIDHLQSTIVFIKNNIEKAENIGLAQNAVKHSLLSMVKDIIGEDYVSWLIIPNDNIGGVDPLSAIYDDDPRVQEYILSLRQERGDE